MFGFGFTVIELSHLYRLVTLRRLDRVRKRLYYGLRHFAPSL